MSAFKSTELREPAHPVFRDWDDAQEIRRLNRINADLLAALAELVALKAMKDEMSHMLLREEGGMGIDYDRREPLAWQRARELVGSNASLRGAEQASPAERPSQSES